MQNSRRLFLKTLVLGTAAVVIAPMLKLQQSFAAAVDVKKDPLASALGYVSDAKTSKKRTDKKAQCSNCQFYGDPTGKAEMAKCQLIASGEVSGKGWCNSYSKRPEVKKS